MPFLVVALVLSALACAGSLYLSLGMGLKACTLCFYQRAFAFGLVGVLLSGLLALRDRPGKVCLLALPLAVGGFQVAWFHVGMGVKSLRGEADWILVCPQGIGGFGTAPQQSFAAFLLILAVLLLGAIRDVRATKSGGLALVAALGLGIGATVGSLFANPPTPKPTDANNSVPLDTCKPTWTD